MTHEYSILIRESHLDTFKHVNNATYLELFEEARWEILSQRGLSLEDIERTGIGIVVLEAHIKFLRETRLRERVVVQTQPVQFEGKVGTVQQTMMGPEGEIKATLEIKLGLFDLSSRKLIAPDDNWRAKLT